MNTLQISPDEWGISPEDLDLITRTIDAHSRAQSLPHVTEKLDLIKLRAALILDMKTDTVNTRQDLENYLRKDKINWELMKIEEAKVNNILREIEEQWGTLPIAPPDPVKFWLTQEEWDAIMAEIRT